MNLFIFRELLPSQVNHITMSPESQINALRPCAGGGSNAH